MGYRSEVALVLSKNGSQTLTAMLAEHGLAQETRDAVRRLQSQADEHYFDPVTGAEAYRWKRVKWYEDDKTNFPHIVFFQKLRNRLPEDDYLFLRFGEDFDDGELRGDFWDNPFEADYIRCVMLSQPA